MGGAEAGAEAEGGAASESESELSQTTERELSTDRGFIEDVSGPAPAGQNAQVAPAEIKKAPEVEDKA